jgi:lipopolysaccharide transport system ATP-binding protein
MIDTNKHDMDRFAALSTQSDVLIYAENVSKKFCKSLRKSLWYGLKDIAYELNPFATTSFARGAYESVRFGRSAGDELLRQGEFWAIKNASLSVRRGECLGLIGKNGAGKTTLLKILTSLIKPDSGIAMLKGRVGALISLGAGFNPVLSGRENIYVNTSILGLSKIETDARVDDIISFAELNDFIDSPVMNYSSGMQLRLGFAIATSFVPDVLILDEVFAVGDVSFGFKCWKRLSEIKKNCAVVLVSHSNTNLARLCTHGVLMENGILGEKLPIDDALGLYRKNSEREGCADTIGHRMQCNDVLEIAFDRKSYNVKRGDSLYMRLKFTPEKALEIGRIEFTLVGANDIPCCKIVISDAKIGLSGGGVSEEIVIKLPNLQLSEGFYRVLLGVYDRNFRGMLFYSRFESGVLVESGSVSSGLSDNELCYSPDLEITKVNINELRQQLNH